MAGIYLCFHGKGVTWSKVVSVIPITRHRDNAISRVIVASVLVPMQMGGSDDRSNDAHAHPCLLLALQFASMIKWRPTRPRHGLVSPRVQPAVLSAQTGIRNDVLRSAS